MCAANRLNTGVKLQGASINIPENSQLVTDPSKFEVRFLHICPFNM